MKRLVGVFLGGAVVVTSLLYQSAWAQVPPSIIPPPFLPTPPRLPEEIRPAPPPSPLLPPAPVPPPTAKPLPLSVFVREIRIIGSTVFTPEELATVTAPYTNRTLASEDLEVLRVKLTQFYIDRGYITSGAIIPDQTVAEGIITYQIIEGKLSRIDVAGNYWFFPEYLQDRIALGAGPPVNINALQERLQLLQETPGIAQVNAELKPGIQRGESVINVRVAEASPLQAWVEFNNYLPPAIGAEQGLFTIAHQSFTGHGDTVYIQAGGSRGVNPELTARYVLPLTARDTTFAVQYRLFDAKITESPFNSLDIQSKANTLSFTLRQPLYKTLNQEFAIALTGEYLVNKVTQAGFPTNFFTPGSSGGISTVSALRFSQEWVGRSPNQVLSAFSRFSLGLDVLGATGKDSSIPDSADSRFLSWLGEVQWVRRLESLWNIQLIARASVQLANAHLFLLEQMGVGGRYTVRGYREFTLVRDNAQLASLEARIPVFPSRLGGDRVQVAPFADFGRGTNTNAATATPDTLGSLGLGAIWNIMQGSRFEVYWGIPLNHVTTQGGNLQDSGVHLQLVVEVL